MTSFLGISTTVALFLGLWTNVHSFAIPGTSSFVAQKTVSKNVGIRQCNFRRRRATLTMRDASASYWFQVGDKVRVVANDVEKAGINLEGRIGTVMETWEKCDVDPTCCCAEQVEKDMAVRVEFSGTEADANAQNTSFTHYFAEEELVKEQQPAAAFDGMTCTAFKLDQLEIGGQKPRGIASYDPNAAASNGN